MSGQYDNTNSGALFKNDDKAGPDGKESWPDYKGRINVNGTDFWLSAWMKASKEGKKYMSLSVQPMKGEAPKPNNGKQVSSMPADFSDDIPF
jgi:hypothetical protein